MRDPEDLPDRAADAQRALADVATWRDPAWKCSPVLPDVAPPLAELRAAVKAPDRGVIVVRDDQGTVIGLAVYRTKDARVIWLVARPAEVVEVAEKIGVAVLARTGQAPWGVIENDQVRAAILTSPKVEAREHLVYPGQAIRWVGP